MAAVEKQVLYALAQKTGRVVDLAYSSLVHQLGLTQRFFKEGFGQLEVSELMLLAGNDYTGHFIYCFCFCFCDLLERVYD